MVIQKHPLRSATGVVLFNSAYYFSTLPANLPLLVMNLRRMSTASMRTTPTGSAIIQFCTKPAMMKLMNDTTATVIAYGSWVETWLMWLH